MPRRNKSIKHVPFQPRNNEQGKTRYGTQREAEQAAERQMLLQSELELRVYRALDGGWYLTRQKKTP